MDVTNGVVDGVGDWGHLVVDEVVFGVLVRVAVLRGVAVVGLVVDEGDRLRDVAGVFEIRAVVNDLQGVTVGGVVGSVVDAKVLCTLAKIKVPPIRIERWKDRERIAMKLNSIRG